jgi:hypothetical protein
MTCGFIMPGLWVIVKSLGMHAGAVRDGSVALIRRPGPGRPGKLGDQDGPAAPVQEELLCRPG